MRGALWVIMGLTLAGTPAVAGTLTPNAAPDTLPPSTGSTATPSPADAEQGAIQHVIERQFEAFRDDDGPAAMAMASPGIQAMFGNDPATFMAMVRRGYQPVYRPRSITFGALAQSGAGRVQRVDVIGPDGVPHTALYTMERQPDGSWRIGGCSIVDAAAVGA